MVKGAQAEEDTLNQIKRQGWYNETDNLTSLRHLQKAPDDDCLVVLLAGYEDIRDQSSLQDFFHLDQKCLWEICLKRSFENWVEDALKEYVNPDGNEERIKQIADIFKDLYHHGLTDPLEVSRYLEYKDFSSAMDGNDALNIVLADLEQFGLPNMIGFQKHGSKSFATYIVAARKFLSYNSFLDAGNNKKAIRKVDRFSVDNEDEPPKETLGTFPI